MTEKTEWWACLECEHMEQKEHKQDFQQRCCPKCGSLRWCHESVAFLLRPDSRVPAPKHHGDRMGSHRAELQQRQRESLREA